MTTNAEEDLNDDLITTRDGVVLGDVILKSRDGLAVEVSEAIRNSGAGVVTPEEARMDAMCVESLGI